VDGAENQGRWYKFDDEDVFPANRREAVDLCYGDRQTRGFSSAYMLVYIRESEAAEVMAGVEIPSDLLERLEQERAKAALDMMLRVHNGGIRQVQYFLEEDVAMFHNYTRGEDFVSEASYRTITMVKGLYCYALQFALAKELGVYPHQIEIWKTFQQNDTKSLRLQNKIPCGVFIKNFDFPFFVRIAENASHDETMRLSYQELYEEEQVLLADLRVAYTPAGLAGPLPFDPVEGMGIGRGILKIRKLADPDGTKLADVNKRLSEESLSVIEKYTEETPSTVKYVFFKVFDDEFLLPRPCYQLSCRYGDDSLLDTKDMDQCKIAYIGSGFIDDTEPMEDIRYTVMSMLRNCFVNAGRDFPDAWQDFYLFDMTPDHNIEYILDDDGVRQPEFISHGTILCCVPGPSSDNFDATEARAKDMLHEHISYEISKIPVPVSFCKHSQSGSPAKFFKRLCGLWSLSGCDSATSADDEWLVTLSLEQSCVSAAALIASQMQVDRTRVLVGKEYFNPQGTFFFKSLQSYQQRPLKDFYDFFVDNRFRIALQVACMPMELPPGDELSSRRYLEFDLVDQRMRAQRRSWLESTVYKQADHMYNMQRKDILSMAESVEDGVNVMKLRHVYKDVNWPQGVTPVADEFVSDSVLYLTFESDASLTFHDVVQKARRNILLTSTADERAVSGKRTIEMISDEEATENARVVRSRADTKAPGVVSINEMIPDVPQRSVICSDPEVVDRCAWSHLLPMSEDADMSAAELTILAFFMMNHEIVKIYGASYDLSDVARSW
jgi:hypothetical protein